ncbi:MAG TPA: IS256 family transposase [Acidobacteriota bacterium]|nr:IS256 family transposase [Acidobacteriota bacterium]
MASRTKRQDEVNRQDGTEAAGLVADQLEGLARQGARQMLMEALNEEVEAYLHRGRYQRSDEAAFRGYRNGSWPRRLTLGSGTIDLKVPRVRDVPRGQEPFGSKIIRKYQRRSDTIDETFLKLFIEGLATRDFEPALRLLMGGEAPLSASVISRLTQRFKAQYEAFDGRDLTGTEFVYIWADGIYLKAGIGTEKACLMVLIGADREGQKHLIALREGYRESAESWGDLLRDCRKRGLNEPACWIADGNLGLWAAVNEHSRRSAQQRCTNHKTMNVVDKLPVKERPEYIKRLRAVWQASNESASRRLAANLVRDLRAAGYERAGRCLEDDLDRCLTFYQFPEVHWSHLRTTNVIESPFASVRLRTNAAKRFKKTKSGVYLVFEVLLRLQRNWRRLKSAHVCATVALPTAGKKRKAHAA